MKYTLISIFTLLMCACSPDHSVLPEAYSSGPTPVPVVSPKTPVVYPVHKDIMTTLFWVGEEAGDDNGDISNVPSAWQDNWLAYFGCIDSPSGRLCTPKENPYYVALPYNDFGKNGRKAQAEHLIPWAKEMTYQPNESMMKNRWIMIEYKGRTCYGQVQDVGPFEEDDYSYVFGKAPPKNRRGVKSGLDVSPALWSCLGLIDNDRVNWSFLDLPPVGPWTQTITTSQTDWQ